MELRLRRDLLLLQRARDGERLEGRAGLVGRADGAVLAREVGGVAGLVGVDARPVGEREQRAGARVHDDRRGGVRAPGLADVREHLLGLVLDRLVDRERDLGAGLGRARLAQLDRLAERVLDQAALAVAAAQLGVERVLEPRQAGALGADAADQLGGEEVARVGAAVLGDELEPLDLHPLDAPRADRGHAVGEVGEAGVAARELLEELALGRAQGARELGGDLGRVLDQVRRHGDGRRGLGDGELDPVAVGDRAALGGDGDLRGLLGRGDLAQRVGAHHPEPAGAQAGEREHGEEDREEEADPSFDQPHGALTLGRGRCRGDGAARARGGGRGRRLHRRDRRGRGRRRHRRGDGGGRGRDGLRGRRGRRSSSSPAARPASRARRRRSPSAHAPRRSARACGGRRGRRPGPGARAGSARRRRRA